MAEAAEYNCSLSDDSPNENEAFLLSEKGCESRWAKQSRWWSFSRSLSVPVWVVLLFLVPWIMMGIWVVQAFAAQLNNSVKHVYSPAHEVISYVPVTFNVEDTPGESSPFAGPPRKGLDEAWHELLQYSNVRLTDSEMDRIDTQRKAESVHLPDGGWFATFQFWHELHCIKHIHRFIWPETYFPNVTSAQHADQKIHLEHCLDTLRQGIMCRADITPVTMRWGKKQAVPLGNFSSQHECVNWEALIDWIRPRSISNIFDPGYLNHPIWGQVYTEENLENSNIVGVVHDS